MEGINFEASQKTCIGVAAADARCSFNLTSLIGWLVDYNSPSVILGREAEDILSALTLDGRPGDVHGVEGT